MKMIMVNDSTMKIKVKASTMVKPMIAKPTTTMWLSNLDLIMPPNYHTPIAIFYRSTGAADFFDSSVLEAALGRALVEFYPLAGRLMKNECSGRDEISCNGEGALLVEAECDGTVGDLGDFSIMPELRLTPTVDYSRGLSTIPLLLIQVTRFKCSGVCLGFLFNHEVADGFSMFHFIRTWSEMCRGLDISIRPSMDRRILSARNPPQPQFPHVEFLTPPTLEITSQHNYSKTPSETIFSIFKLTRDQLNALKAKANCHDQAEKSNRVMYSTYTLLAGHAWRCVTRARALPEDQESMLFIPMDGRSRLQPRLPRGYFGNAVFVATCIALCGELDSNPLEFAASKIQAAIARMDDEYMRSAIDSSELELRCITFCKSPNLTVNSWAGFGVNEMDFGWGKPVFMGYCGDIPEGICLVLPSPTNDGSLFCAITLPQEQMQVFEDLLYDI